jgi:hypothetical protein
MRLLTGEILIDLDGMVLLRIIRTQVRSQAEHRIGESLIKCETELHHRFRIWIGDVSPDR